MTYRYNSQHVNLPLSRNRNTFHHSLPSRVPICVYNKICIVKLKLRDQTNFPSSLGLVTLGFIVEKKMVALVSNYSIGMFLKYYQR